MQVQHTNLQTKDYSTSWT